MILIISDEQDQSTDDVIDWLRYYRKEYIRVNYEDFISNIYVDCNNIKLIYKEKEVDINSIDSFWQRKGFFNYLKMLDFRNVRKDIKNHILNEWKTIDKYIYYKLSKKKGIYNLNENINKLIVLNVAQKVGLRIPKFIITDKKCQIFENCVIKSISEPFDLMRNEYIYSSYTEVIESVKYENFFATLFQEKITALYELRSIFILNKCWTMAIFNPSKDVDYRKNYSNLRYTPYNLPQKIQNKIFKLMKILKLKYGAVDLIVDQNSNYYFLEINPFGQFGMVSEPCNYQIEKYIAEIL